MLILISCLLLFVTALTLIVLRAAQPNARYTWLVAVGGAMLALVSVFIWLAQMPFDLVLPAWQPARLFTAPILFRADGISWPFAFGIAGLTLSILLTAVTRPVFVNSFAWVGTLALGGLGILAVTANNPLTLLLVWAALDMAELLIQLGFVNGSANNEKVVISFSTRALGTGALLWASIVSISGGGVFDFQSMSNASGIYLVIAAGLRLGVLPIHLPYSSDSMLRRSFGTGLRLISAASSLILLGRIPAGGLHSLATPILMLLATITAVYAGWMWLRAPDELNGRPYWIISLASLSVIASLSGNPLGAVAWGCALLLVGGALFLASVQQVWLNRLMLLGAWSLSSLPFSLTASAWLGSLGFFIPFVIIAQALVIAGFIRHALRPAGRDSLETQPGWTRAVYPSGIILLIALQFLLGWIGWDGALQFGAWLQAVIVSLLTFGLVWAIPRFRVLNPIRAHWVTISTTARLNTLYQGLWSLYRALGRISQAITVTLEGEGGIMWTLLFLVLFVSLLTQGTP
ncbi:MAG: hypothetical protein Q7J80_11355 [Anaerolineales bacterium]|nr:hypothetical protein [Anaerolineales bacterium]